MPRLHGFVLATAALPLLASLAAQTWVETPGGGSPRPLTGSTMWFDDRLGRCAMFGGFDESAALLDETWEWDGRHWERIDTAVRPPATGGATIVYDDRRGRALLLGNAGGSWQRVGRTWSPFLAGLPAGRFLIAACYDHARDRVVMLASLPSPPPLRPETWEWDGTAWVQQFPLQAP